MIKDSQNAATETDLDERTADSDPLKLFQLWFSEAIKAKLPLPEGMTLATATRDGSPSARLVLLKQVDEQGFVFFTNYESQKARELDANPIAELVFWWPTMERQVRIHGTVTRISAAESDRYFRTRPRESQLGALASPQSQVIANRDYLEERFAKLEKLYQDREIERPDHWGGYRLKPERIEFWKGRSGRLHDRLLYERTASGDWTISRLAP